MVEQQKHNVECTSLQPTKYYKHFDESSGMTIKRATIEVNGSTNFNKQSSSASVHLSCKPVHRGVSASTSSAINQPRYLRNSNVPDSTKHYDWDALHPRISQPELQWNKVDMKADVQGIKPFVPGLCFEDKDKNRRGGCFLELSQEYARPTPVSQNVDGSVASDIYRIDVDSEKGGLRPGAGYDELMFKPKTIVFPNKEFCQLQAQQMLPTSQHNEEPLQSYWQTSNPGLTSTGQTEAKRPPSNQLLLQTENPCEELESVVETSRKRPSIGPDFQAELPPYIYTAGTAPQSIKYDPDSYRWLGTNVWPPRGHITTLCKAKVGEGRPDVCSCTLQGSIDCVRLHIEEKREALKDNIGEAFCAWGFDKMGENVSDMWMHDEELNFQEIIRMDHISLKNSFWNSLLVAFPSKNMADLVSYYFNVFVVRRRAMQNRYTPENIDSDDDETDLFESEGDESPSMLEVGAEGDSGVEDDASEDETGDLVSHISEVSGDEECIQVCNPSSWDISSNSKTKSDGLMENPVVHPPSSLSATMMDYQNSGKFETKSNDWVGTQGDKIRAGQTWGILNWDHTACHFSSKEEKRMGMMHAPLFCNDRQVAEDSSACKDGLLVSLHPPTLDQYESKVWECPVEISSRKDVDKLISTNGMMREFFGDEDWKFRD